MARRAAQEFRAGEVVGLEPQPHPLDLSFVGVIPARRGLVGFAVADQVRGDNAHAGGGQVGDYMPIQVAPHRLAVHAQHHWTIGRTFIKVVNTQVAPVVGLYGGVVGRERIVRQSFEACVGGSKYLHFT